MLRLHFNHVFFALMALSAIVALAAPPQSGSAGRGPLQTLLIPISAPSYRLANLIRGRFTQGQIADARPQREIEQENDLLRQEILEMKNELERLQQLAGERQSLGNLQSLCRRMTVTGTDGDSRDGLIVAGAGSGRLEVEQPVLSGGKLIGWVDRAGLGSGHVRLLTDAGFTFTGNFFSFSPGWVQPKLQAIVRGRGHGQMSITNLALEDIRRADVRIGDWVVLADQTWPAAVQGVYLGQIASIAPLSRQSQFADIRVLPQTSPMHLSDVWVLERQN